MNAGWWALFLACVAGVVLAAGTLTRFSRQAAVAALVLFAVAGVLAVVVEVD